MSQMHLSWELIRGEGISPTIQSGHVEDCRSCERGEGESKVVDIVDRLSTLNIVASCNCGTTLSIEKWKLMIALFVQFTLEMELRGEASPLISVVQDAESAMGTLGDVSCRSAPQSTRECR